MLRKTSLLLFSGILAIGWRQSEAFVASPHLQQKCPAAAALYGSDMGYDDNSGGYETNNDNNDLLLIREFLQKNYPDFYTILNMNDEVWKAIGDTQDGAEQGFTVFAPTPAALQALGAEKQNQIFDERNSETTEKIAAYHVIGESVSVEALFNSRAVITVGGEVPIERTVSGGLFGVGGQEDGGVTLNGAKILRTANVGSGLLHEVDGLVNPNIMWRFMDQLRIPGST